MQLDFTQYLILILLGLLFVRETIVRWISQKLGIKDKSPIETLKTYYNHDLSERLDRIERAEEHEHDANEQVRATLISIDRSLNEFREYGIKIRK